MCKDPDGEAPSLTEGTQRALFAPRGVPRGGHKPPGCARRPGAPWWVVPTLGAPRTTSLLYKYPKNPRTLGESTKYSSSSRRVQNHQIQSRHHHGGVHHFHWCLSDDVWVVLYRWLPLSLSRLILNTMVSWRSIWCNSFAVCLLGSDELWVYDQIYLFISMKVFEFLWSLLCMIAYSLVFLLRYLGFVWPTWSIYLAMGRGAL